jgi:hypothetical protein
MISPVYLLVALLEHLASMDEKRWYEAFEYLADEFHVECECTSESDLLGSPCAYCRAQSAVKEILNGNIGSN